MTQFATDHCKGATKSILCDLQRQKYYEISNEGALFLKSIKGESVESLEKRYVSIDGVSVRDYLNFLVDYDIVFFTHDCRLFPEMSLEWYSPKTITNGIIDLSKKTPLYDFEDVFHQYSSLGAEYLQIRIFDNQPEKYIKDIIKSASESDVLNLQIYLPYDTNLFEPKIKTFFSDCNLAISLIVHSTPINKLEEINNALEKFSSSFATTNILDSESHCGIVDSNMFVVNVNSFTESIKFNSCLNQKISIDQRGNICNCPSMSEKYGNVKSVRLEDVITINDFQKKWYLSKDSIEGCSICEYRYICTDCRAYLENPINIKSKPLKCGYDPTTGQWENWKKDTSKIFTMGKYENKIKFIIILFFASFLSCVPSSPSLGMYYDNINDAEINIVEDNLLMARRAYQKADKLKKMNFFDYYNYSVCAVKLNSFSRAKSPVLRLIEMGLPLSYIENKRVFNDFTNSRVWEKIRKKKPAPTYSPELRNEIQRMLAWDQEFRSSYKENYDTISIIDSINGIRILEILQKNGNVGPQHIGIEMRNDTTIKKGWNGFTILLIHQVKRDRTGFSKLLRSLVLDGKMSPSAYAGRSADFSPIDSIRLNCFQPVGAQLIQVRDELYICNEEDVSLIDAQREKIFLPSLADQRKKFEYYYEKDRSYYLGGNVFTYSGVKNQQEAKPIIEDLLKAGFELYRTLPSTKAYYLLNREL